MIRSPTLLLLAAAMACGTPEAPDPDIPPDSTVVPKGTRLLGIALNDRADGDFNLAYSQAVDAGVDVVSMPLAWDDLETAPGVYEPDPDFLSIGASYYGARGMRISLGLNPIDTNNLRVPPHLQGLAWDDPGLIEAFIGLLDWAIPKMAGADLVLLSIGNEINGSLSTSAEWEAYATFFEGAASHARSLRPGLRVGSKVTHGGLTGVQAADARLVNETADVILTTFYPLNPDFTIRPPASAGVAMDEIVAAYPGRPIIFSEIGSPSTEMCGSSHALQAEFITEAFAAWDRHADQIETLEFVWMHDISQEVLGFYEGYYGVSNPCFLEYLGTLGLKSAAGEDKPAWDRLVFEAGRRGW